MLDQSANDHSIEKRIKLEITFNMNRLDKLFQKKQKDVLAIYATAGFPNLDDTRRTILELDQAGADIIEIGMPFSDPLADGSTIQASSQKAIDNGMTLKLLFEQLKSIRTETDIPIVLMGYLNPVMVFGVEAFCEKCQEVGVDGLILPDLPMWEFEHTYQPIFKKYGLHAIFLVTPQTSDERVKILDAASGGFLYAVSVSTTTGKSGRFDRTQEAYFKRLSELNLKNPVLVGFGIAGPENFSIANKYLNGGVVGSAFIRAMERGEPVKDFVNMIRQVETVPSSLS